MLGLITPSQYPFAVTPSDTAFILTNGKLCKGFYVGTAGNVAVERADGTAVVFANVPAGSVLPVMTRRIKATGTTASDIVALF